MAVSSWLIRALNSPLAAVDIDGTSSNPIKNSLMFLNPSVRPRATVPAQTTNNTNRLIFFIDDLLPKRARMGSIRKNATIIESNKPILF
jgi:hypothetical protein